MGKPCRKPLFLASKSSDFNSKFSFNPIEHPIFLATSQYFDPSIPFVYLQFLQCWCLTHLNSAYLWWSNWQFHPAPLGPRFRLGGVASATRAAERSSTACMERVHSAGAQGSQGVWSAGCRTQRALSSISGDDQFLVIFGGFHHDWWGFHRVSHQHMGI